MQGADYIIALTHMRWPNDTHLAEEVDEIDLILGGHDHDYGLKQVSGTYLLIHKVSKEAAYRPTCCIIIVCMCCFHCVNILPQMGENSQYH